MTALNRRVFLATTAATVATPTALGAKECPTMDWITMSLEARNLAYNNVEHVGPDNARKKTEGWAAASKRLREPHTRVCVAVLRFVSKKGHPSGTCSSSPVPTAGSVFACGSLFSSTLDEPQCAAICEVANSRPARSRSCPLRASNRAATC